MRQRRLYRLSWFKRKFYAFLRPILEAHEQAKAWTAATCPCCHAVLAHAEAAYCSTCGAPVCHEPHTEPEIVRVLAASPHRRTGDLMRASRDLHHIPREDTQTWRAVNGLPRHYGLREEKERQ